MASNLEPKSAQDLPTWSQDRPKMLQIGTNMSPRPLTCNEDGPKRPPRSLMGPILGPKRPPRSLMGPILMDFGLQFHDFCLHVGRFWTPFHDKELQKSSKCFKRRHTADRQVSHHHHHASLVHVHRFNTVCRSSPALDLGSQQIPKDHSMPQSPTSSLKFWPGCGGRR